MLQISFGSKISVKGMNIKGRPGQGARTTHMEVRVGDTDVSLLGLPNNAMMCQNQVIVTENQVGT